MDKNRIRGIRRRTSRRLTDDEVRIHQGRRLQIRRLCAEEGRTYRISYVPEIVDVMLGNSGGRISLVNAGNGRQSSESRFRRRVGLSRRPHQRRERH